MPFQFHEYNLPGLILIEPKVFNDDRGFFLESFKYSDFNNYGITSNFLQDNHSYSKKGVIRGLHFQKNPMPQGKLVRVIKGSVFDVAVDLRKKSPAYLQWAGVELSDHNNKLLWIPEGFAHGFAVTSDEAILLYKCTNEYNQSLDSGIIWNDPQINIKWPFSNPLLSEKDINLPLLCDSGSDF